MTTGANYADVVPACVAASSPLPRRQDITGAATPVQEDTPAEIFWLGINDLESRDIASAAHLPQVSVECSYKCDVESVPDTESETSNGRDSGLI